MGKLKWGSMVCAKTEGGTMIDAADDHVGFLIKPASKDQLSNQTTRAIINQADQLSLMADRMGLEFEEDEE